MSSKRRKLSPTPSSASSSTPAPVFPVLQATGHLPSTASSPPPENDARSDGVLQVNGYDAGTGGGGSSRAGSVSADVTPAPMAAPVSTTAGRTERTEMRMPTKVAGSGDGVEHGPECFAWTDLPIQSGYRYMPCGLSPIPSPNPSFPFYRTIPPPVGTPNVHLSWTDRSSFLRASPDGMTVSTERGFRSARCNMSVREGTWYYEVHIDRGDGSRGVGKGTGGGEVPNAHVRVGWGRREAILDAPVGYDGYSYGLRDTSCERLHLSRRKPYGQDRGRHIGTGDIIGCLITLPDRRTDEMKRRMEDTSDPASIKRARAPLRFKGQWYLESEEYHPAKEMEALVDREGKLAKEAEEAARLAAAADPSSDDKENNAGAKVVKGGTGKTKQTTHKGGKNGKNGKLPSDQQQQQASRKAAQLAGSSIAFFLNGEPLSDRPAFEDLFDFAPMPLASSSSSTSHNTSGGGGKKHTHEPAAKGVLHDDGTLGYYPMVSVYGRGKVTVNFGPNWAKPPSTLSSMDTVRPMCDRWDEFREEERAQDEKDELEWIERIRQDQREEEVKREALLKRKLAADARKCNKVKRERDSKAGTPASSSGAGARGGKPKSTGTPRSRLGTSVTPGPGFAYGDTPSSPASMHHGDAEADGVKMEVESVMASSSRAPSPKLEPGQDEDAQGEEDVDDAMVAKSEDEEEEREPVLFPDIG